jgi:hypothetical protein
MILKRLKREGVEGEILREIEAFEGRWLKRVGEHPPSLKALNMGHYNTDPEGMILKDYLNNFIHHLHPNGYKRRAMRDLGYWDTPGGSWLEQREDHSPLFLRQTPREFYAAIDAATAECVKEGSFNTERFRQIAEQFVRMKEGIELARMAFPVYVKLRKMGYTQHELTG